MHWRVAYPTHKYTHSDKPRAVTLVNSKISTNMWRQIDFPSADVVIIQINTSSGLCMVINVYNNNNHNDTIEEPTNIAVLRPTEEDHMMWLGDFNRHHPLWDEDRNSHLFTAAALEASGKLLKLVADYSMTQALPKDVPTLQSSSTRNWTCPDNVFCMEHTSQSLLECNMAPERHGPKTDHLPILTTLDMSLTALSDSPLWNYY